MRHALPVVLLGLLSFATPASAAPPGTCQGPPGNSGIDQYCEVIPGPGGSEEGGSGHRRRAAPQARDRLARRGGDGAAVLGLVEAGDTGAAAQPSEPATRSAGARGRGHRRTRSHSPGISAAAPSADGVGAVSAATSGVGTAVWVLVALIAALAAAAVVVRRRRGAA